MKYRAPGIAALLLILAVSINAQRTVPARELPLPAAASPEVQASIIYLSNNPILAPEPTLDSEWEAYIRNADAGPSKFATLIANAFQVTLEQSEIAGVPVYRATPSVVYPRHAEHLFVYLHGGAYVLSGGIAGAVEAAARVGIKVLSIEYRMPPEHPFPAAIEDTVAVYRSLLETQPTSGIVIGGASAGGGLTLATIHKLIEIGVDVPGAISTGTPWADLTKTGDTLFTNDRVDGLLITYDGFLEAAAHLYAGDHDLRNPLISLVYGTFDGFPTRLPFTGTRDLFLSETARVHRKLREAGVIADLNVYEGMSHSEYLSPQAINSPESLQICAEMGEFLKTHLNI